LRILENSLETDFSKDIKSGFLFNEEFDLIKTLSNYKDILIESTSKNAPHILCKYAYDLSIVFDL
jgi:arginyl-tRNA synthetase